MWERFSYYGMKALLVLYMVKYLLHPEHAQTVIGFAALKAALESIFGPLELQPLSSQIYGLYTGLVYLTPVLGGYLADRVLGQRRMVIIGASLMAVGHFMMAFEPLFLLALLTSDSRQRRLQAEHLHPGRHALCAGRSAPRQRLFDLLCRHQSRRVPRAAGLRHARRDARLALRLRRRRRRHDARAVHLSLCLAHLAARSAHPPAIATGAAARPRRMARARRTRAACPPRHVLLGAPTSSRATPSRCGPMATPIA